MRLVFDTVNASAPFQASVDALTTAWGVRDASTDVWFELGG
jgi:hypothetical protein